MTALTRTTLIASIICIAVALSCINVLPVIYVTLGVVAGTGTAVCSAIPVLRQALSE